MSNLALQFCISKQTWHIICVLAATVYKRKNMGHWAYNNNNVNNNSSNYYYNNVDIIKLQNKGAYMHVKVYFK